MKTGETDHRMVRRGSGYSARDIASGRTAFTEWHMIKIHHERRTRQIASNDFGSNCDPSTPIHRSVFSGMAPLGRYRSRERSPWFESAGYEVDRAL